MVAKLAGVLGGLLIALFVWLDCTTGARLYGLLVGAMAGFVYFIVGKVS